MENNKIKDKKKLITSIIITILIVSIFGGTLAYYDWKSTEAQKTVVTVTVKPTFECAIDGGGPIESSNYQLIPTNCDANSEYVIKREVKVKPTLDNDENSILFDVWINVNKLTTGLSNNEHFKYALTSSSTSCTEGVIASGNFNGLLNDGTAENIKTETILSNTYDSTTEDTFYLYIWLAREAGAETMNQEFSLSLNGNCTNNGDIINGAAPVLDTGMIPVKIANDGTVTTVSENDLTWYNYPNKQWANAVLVKESGTQTRTYYKNNTDVTISESDILAYYVWIPRYKYKILSPIIASSDTITPETIDIVFETANTPKSSGTSVGEYLTHPAFTFGEEELNGFWIGKFESTGSATSPTILPNATSLSNRTVSQYFTTSQLFSASNNTYGLSNTTTDSHMIKNSEWAAVAYLSHSQYGINGEIEGNRYNVTGKGSASSSIYGSLTSYPQSTTGNITGVFDMSGGYWEYVMGNYSNMVGNSGFSTMPDSKYYDSYGIDNLSLCTISSCAGHALYETTNWYGDAAEFVNASDPWFRRGVDYQGDYMGAFAYEMGYGGECNNCSSRSVLAIS